MKKEMAFEVLVQFPFDHNYRQVEEKLVRELETKKRGVVHYDSGAGMGLRELWLQAGDQKQAAAMKKSVVQFFKDIDISCKVFVQKVG